MREPLSCYRWGKREWSGGPRTVSVIGIWGSIKHWICRGDEKVPRWDIPRGESSIDTCATTILSTCPSLCPPHTGMFIYVFIFIKFSVLHHPEANNRCIPHRGTSIGYGERDKKNETTKTWTPDIYAPLNCVTFFMLTFLRLVWLPLLRRSVGA